MCLYTHTHTYMHTHKLWIIGTKVRQNKNTLLIDTQHQPTLEIQDIFHHAIKSNIFLPQTNYEN